MLEICQKHWFQKYVNDFDENLLAIKIMTKCNVLLYQKFLHQVWNVIKNTTWHLPLKGRWKNIKISRSEIHGKITLLLRKWLREKNTKNKLSITFKNTCIFQKRFEKICLEKITIWWTYCHKKGKISNINRRLILQ